MSFIRRKDRFGSGPHRPSNRMPSQERLKRAARDLHVALAYQSQKMKQFHETMEKLKDRVQRLENTWVEFGGNLARINFKPLKRNARRLARIMD